MAKLILLAFSDLHISDWGRFETRLDTSFTVLKKLRHKAELLRVPLIHTGDLFDRPDRMSNYLMNRVSSEFSRQYKSTMYCISGNHSCETINKIGETPNSWEQYFARMFSWIKPVDFSSVDLGNGVTIHGVPYIDHNIGLPEYLKNLKLSEGKNILLLHTDYPGAKDGQGMEVGTYENININMMDRFDLVLCGHIHKPQRLSKKVYMLGAPYQQRRTDQWNDAMGYWEVYDDMTMNFKPFSGFPEFIDVDDEGKIQDDGNYYTVVKKIKENTPESQETRVTLDLSKKRMVRTYLKEIGVKDKAKKKLILDTLNEVEEC